MKNKVIVVGLVLVFLLCACDVDQSSDKGNCQKPEGFSEQELVGTWKAGWAKRNDTIIIRNDGLYKQILHVETEKFDHESDWQRWRVEYHGDVPYLHLEGMRMCVYWSGVDCEQIGGGDLWWYDFCQKESVKMPNEGVLIILGYPGEFAEAFDGFNLFAFQVHTESTTVYQLEER